MIKKLNHDNEKPPVMKTWPRLYWLVFLSLVFWLTFFYIFKEVFG